MTNRIADAEPLPNYLKLGEFCKAFYGANTLALRHRVMRMVDAGEVKALRLGKRGDRLIPRSELDRLDALAGDNLRPRGGGGDAA